MKILKIDWVETPLSRTDEESDSVKDFISVLFAYPAANPVGNVLTGIQLNRLYTINENPSDSY